MGNKGDAWIDWMDYPPPSKGNDREWDGLSMLDAKLYGNVLEEWRDFWPTTGSQQKWDAVGWIRNQSNEPELLLVEAKANIEEIVSSCTAAPHGGRSIIEKAFSEVKISIGVPMSSDWLNTYYQYANRLAVLWFLQKQHIPARLLYVYFVGDQVPNRTCPTSESDWKKALDDQDKHLGLPSNHMLSAQINKLFISI